MRWRHDFHRFPETGFNEHRTANRVAQLLALLGLEVHRGIGGTGVVASLRVGEGAGVIGLRADMDGLAMSERAPGRAHASIHPGACTSAAKTATWRCCSARRSCWRGAGISTARCASSSSPPRTTPEVKDLLEQRLRRLCEGICSVEYTHEFAPTVNRAQSVPVAVQSPRAVVGDARVDADTPLHNAGCDVNDAMSASSTAAADQGG